MDTGLVWLFTFSLFFWPFHLHNHKKVKFEIIDALDFFEKSYKFWKIEKKKIGCDVMHDSQTI